MIRLRWNVLILTGVIFFMSFIMYLNVIPMSDTNPFNDSFLPVFVILGLFIGLPYYVGPFIMKLKSPNINGYGLQDSISTAEPWITIDEVIAMNEDGSVMMNGDKPEVLYPKYNVYLLGSADAFNIKLKGGRWEGTAVFPTALCKKIGGSVDVLAGDIEAHRTIESKRRLPDHALDRIKHEYKLKGWWWNDEYPIFWGETPVQMEAMTLNISNTGERCKVLEADKTMWKDIAKDYESQRNKMIQAENEKERPKFFQVDQQGQSGEGGTA